MYINRLFKKFKTKWRYFENEMGVTTTTPIECSMFQESVDF